MTSGNVCPKRSLGQNHLQDQGVARKIVAALDVRPGDKVLEIGPGLGALTRWLLVSGINLVALEKDVRLALHSKRQWPTVAMIAMDALEFSWERLHGHWRLIGNLPYNVASPIIWEAVSRMPRLAQAVFMVQKEVGQRLAAQPGSRVYGALSVWVQSHVQVRKLFMVGPRVFRPRPRVDSVVVDFSPLPEGRRTTSAPALRLLLRTCFQQRRKQLKTILRPVWSDALGEWLASQGLSPASRPEELSPRQFQILAEKCMAGM